MFRPLDDGRFIWASERSGFRHLYLHDEDGNLLRPLTKGNWLVESINGVDQQHEIVYFTATRGGPTERHLYAVSFEGEEPRQITTAPGTHAITVDHGKTQFIDVHHALDKPADITLRSLADGSAICSVYDSVDPRVAELAPMPPELVDLRNSSGTLLHGAIYRPHPQYGDGPFPTIVWVYGGPHAQLVTDGWGLTVSMRAQYLRSLGYLVFVLDNRGSAGRGLEFENHIKHDMGNKEVEDQVDGVRWLVKRGLADPERVGIYGWSYGGYMALMCLARAADTFKIAVAGAPVTHWDGYDTCYTERYMGTAQSNPQGYEESNVMFFHVDKIRGKLLLVHGLIDENVHFRHTARLINALIRSRKQYELMLFPDERHMPRKRADRIFMEERIGQFFEKHL
jgi:dipeptidyl-peptidase-4